ncbi:semaphorin-2A-like isoform X2 [Antedon mediterranea]|uniref:semaphorin-2A-like isoform X2 n=1 Tax=Antedon mediterranea TaxID=105859 RepID=UPI003AF823C7
MMTLCIAIVIFAAMNVHFLSAQSYTPAEASLKIRDSQIVDKVFENCSNARALVRSEDKILVGCRNKLIQLNFNLTEIKSLDFKVCDLPPLEITCEQAKTTTKENFERDPRNPKLIEECVVDDNGENPALGLYSGKEIGAFNPNQNISSILVNIPHSDEKRLYTATTHNSAETIPMIRRSNISDLNDKTKVIIDKSYEKWLDAPQFVGKPIEYGDRVYFFFREHAQEFNNEGDAVYARVAAVCKNDIGGVDGSSLDGMWTTYIKARLICSLQGTYPFYYDHLQDIYQSPSMNNTIYAVFTTQEYGQPGSALCTYNMDEIELLMNEGDLKGQETPNSLWLKPTIPPTPRPGSCSDVQPEANYAKIRSYSLINQPVPNLAEYREAPSPPTLERDSDNPLLTQKDVRFLQLVVKEDVNDSGQDMFYIGTDRGTLIKFLKPAAGRGILSQEINLNVKEPVLTMELWDDLIFIGSENAIQRLPLNHCDAYNTDFQKCLTKDPYCTEVEASCEVTLKEIFGPENITADPGDAVYLYCHATVEEGIALEVEWLKDNVSLTTGAAFTKIEHLLQGEINYDYLHGKKIENEVRSQLRVFVNAKTKGTYKCRIYGEGFEFERNGTITIQEMRVTQNSYDQRDVEAERLKNLGTEAMEQWSENKQQCTISSSELCEEITEVDLEKQFVDSNPYNGMNTQIET